MVSDEIFPIGKEVPEEADDGMILRNRISGAELSGSAPVVLSYVLMGGAAAATRITLSV